MQTPEATNEALRRSSPALFRALSPLGRRLAFPPDIPFQAGQAREKRYNGTIGQITDGRGGALGLEPLGKALAGLVPEDRNRALLYSPVEGLPELRDRWRRWQRRDLPDSPSGGLPSSRPIVTVGLTHGLSLVADLFGGEGRPVLVFAPYWGNYRQTFAVRTGARMVAASAYAGGGLHCEGIAEAAAELGGEEPVITILNFPSNPGGAMPTTDERERLVGSLLSVAERRPLVAVCDDAYAGLVYEEDVPRRSLFWDLIGRHERLTPVKVDGGTKEFAFFGGRVGFVTFPFDPESEAAVALESKAKCLTRSTLGSPVATSQVILLQALRQDAVAELVEEVRLALAERYRGLREALLGITSPHLRPMPFNAGCFALMELSAGLEAEEVRRHLLDRYDTGLISIGSEYLRIAFCSIRSGDLAELVARLERGVEDLAATAQRRGA